MIAKKSKKLKAMGGRATTVQDFLGLTNEDMAVIEARLALAKLIRERREEAGLTQAALAKSLEPSARYKDGRRGRAGKSRLDDSGPRRRQPAREAHD